VICTIYIKINHEPETLHCKKKSVKFNKKNDSGGCQNFAININVNFIYLNLQLKKCTLIKLNNINT